MKKVVAVFAFLSMAMLVSCSGNGPEEVAKKFLENTSNGEFTEAKKYCDQSTAGMIGMMESMITPEKKAEIKKEGLKIQIKSSEIKDDKATVKYTTTSASKPTPSDEKELKLIKEGKEWKVTMGKEAPGAAPAAPPAPAEPAAPVDPTAPASPAPAPAQ